MPEPSVSIVIPAYNASATIGRTLSSIRAGDASAALEIIVVDDGSDDSDALKESVAAFGDVRLLTHDTNRGKARAMNTGIAASTGDIVVILDADDELVPSWETVLWDITIRWPGDAPICFAAGRTPANRPTVSEPDYTGPLSFTDMLHDRRKGEYIPIFRGPMVRDAGGYHDPGTRWECAQWTYLDYARRASLWVDAAVMRIYHDTQPGSLSSSLAEPARAAEVLACYDRIFETFGEDYNHVAPDNARRRRLRHAVFAALARDKGRAWQLWRAAASVAAPLDSLAAATLISVSGKTALSLVRLAKRLGLVRRYG